MKRQAGLVALALLHIYWLLQPVSLALKFVSVVFVILAVRRPARGLIAFAALAPLSTTIASLCGSAGAGALLLEQIALGIGAGTMLALPASGTRTRIGKPALLIAVIAAASALSVIPASAGFTAGGWAIGDLAARTSAQSSAVWSPLFVALTVCVCSLLAWAVEACVRRTPGLGARVVLFGLVGHAVSAALSVEAVLAAAVRTGHAVAALPQLLLGVRLSLQTDWNAAASLFLLAGIAGTGLLAASGARRIAIAGLVVVVSAGLWITGSRIAIVLAALAAVGSLGWLVARSSRHRRALVIGAAALMVALGAWLIARYPEGRNDKPGDTLRGRLVLMKAGVRMIESAPVFGIGVDGFYAASARLAEPVPGIPDVTPENAHNNFVQVAAEQGVVGLGALLWALGVAVLGAVRAQRVEPTPVRGALLVAVLACLGTWMTGHPLLVPEFALVFWLYAGILTALTPPPAASARWPVWVLIAAIAVSVPFRVSALRADADLEYRGYGVSMWHHDDTQRYRNAGSTFALFLPATGSPIDVPMRRDPGSSSRLVVSIRLGDQVLNQVSIEGDAWQNVVVVVPKGTRKFERVEFAVEPPGYVLRVGRETAR